MNISLIACRSPSGRPCTGMLFGIITGLFWGCSHLHHLPPAHSHQRAPQQGELSPKRAINPTQAGAPNVEHSNATIVAFFSWRAVCTRRVVEYFASSCISCVSASEPFSRAFCVTKALVVCVAPWTCSAPGVRAAFFTLSCNRGNQALARFAVEELRYTFFWRKHFSE